MGEKEMILEDNFDLLLGKASIATPVTLTLQRDGLRIKSSTSCFGKIKKRRTSSVLIPLSRVIGSQTVDAKSGGKRKNTKTTNKVGDGGGKALFDGSSSATFDLKDAKKKKKFGSKGGLFFEGSSSSCALFSVFYYEEKEVKVKGDSLTAPETGEYVFRVDSGESFEHNYLIVKKWRDSINHQLQLSHHQLPLQLRLDRRKRLLILVNPKSGPGKALKIFRETVEPLLQQADLQYDLVITKRSNHCQDLIATEDLKRWSAVVIISGDGLLFEVFQGIFKRSDWRETRETPIAIIAGGSGNGLARALCHEADRKYSRNGIVGTTLGLVRGRVRPMDLICLQTKSGQTVYSFLSVGTGFLSDVDIESEKLRFMGEPRFLFWAIYRVAVLKAYRAVVTYKPCQVSQQSKIVAESVSQDEQEFDEVDNEVKEQEDLESKVLNVDDDDDDVIVDQFAEFERQITERSTSQPWREREEYESVQDVPVHSPSLNLPPFSEELKAEDGWVRVEDKFLVIYVVNVAYVGSDLKIAPAARSDDGCMWLLMVRKGLSKAAFTRTIAAVETGAHVSMPGVEMVPVKAFRLEPLSPKGFLTADGELIAYEPVQAEVLPAFARIVG